MMVRASGIKASDVATGRSAARHHVGLWLLALSMLLAPEARAASVVIARATPGEEMTIKAEAAPVAEILQRLADQCAFKIVGAERAGAAEAMTVDMKGSPDVLVSRLLRNRNHMVVRSPANACGIEKITILNGNYGAANGKFVASPAQGEDLIQALSGTPN